MTHKLRYYRQILFIVLVRRGRATNCDNNYGGDGGKGHKRIPITSLFVHVFPKGWESRFVQGETLSSKVIRPYYPTPPGYVEHSPSPPLRADMIPGPPATNRVIPQETLNELKRSLEVLNLQDSVALNQRPPAEVQSTRVPHSRREHLEKRESRPREWAVNAGNQERNRGIVGLGLHVLNENIDETTDARSQENHYGATPHRRTFEYDGAKSVSTSATAAIRSIRTAAHNAVEDRIQQTFRNEHHARIQPVLDPEVSSLSSRDSHDTTGTFHTQSSGSVDDRRSIHSDVLAHPEGLHNFPSSPASVGTVNSRGSIDSSLRERAFLLPEPPTTSPGNPLNAVSAGISLATPRATAPILGLDYANATPQPYRGTARPRPSRYQTEPVSRNPQPAGTDFGQRRLSGLLRDTPIIEDPSTSSDNFGNALGLDLTRDLGSVAQQRVHPGPTQLIAPTPRPAHNQFLRTFSGGI